MKKIMIVQILFLVIAFSAESQIIFTETKKSNFNFIQLENGEVNYYILNKNRIELYSLADSLLDVIPIAIPSNHSLYEILNVSQLDFNSDTLFEVAYTTIEYDLDNDKYEDPIGTIAQSRSTFYIADSKGNILIEVEGGIGFNIMTNDTGKNLFVFKGGVSGFNDQSFTNIYSIK